MNDIEQIVRIIMNYESLAEFQKKQFKQVIMEGLRGKFVNTLQDDTNSILSIIDIWIRYGFLPMDKNFCAIDVDTGNVLAILLLNNFKKPNLLDSARCLLRVIQVIGLKKSLKIAFNFLAIDNLNKETNQKNIKSEIYLVSTCESQRGKGIGTVLMKHVLDYLHSEYECDLLKNSDYRIKLLVFGKNPAINLYNRLGFKQVRSVATPKIAKAFGSSYDVLIQMEREL